MASQPHTDIDVDWQ